MRPSVHFVTTSDGVRIAYCTHGEGPPLVFVRGWISHLEMMWEVPAIRSYFEALASHHMVVRYDARGNGLSDWDVPEIDLDGLLVDLEAVVDVLALTDITLYGMGHGGPLVVAYAARHPERVARLILEGTYARGEEIASPEQREAMIAALSKLRSLPGAAFSLLDYLTYPEEERFHHERVERSRRSISANAAAQLYSLVFRIDVSALLSEIRAPTLVLHRRRCRAVPFEQGRKLASLIPGAQFVALEGTAQNPWEEDASGTLAAIGNFLGVELRLAPSAGPAVSPAPLTILFTDMEGSTTLTQRLGDAKAREVLRTHERIMREALRAHGGAEVKTMGDGFMASFSSATRALECAIAMQRAFARHNESAEEPVRVRIGLNAGEPIAEEEDLFGTAVILAARIAARAKGGEILASDVVRQLVAGKGFLFADRGEATLRGFEEQVRLYEVKWREPA
jgi:class 3 adenylate cyclase/alpha-beta hydrolase superfamily lysophospholipase